MAKTVLVLLAIIICSSFIFPASGGIKVTAHRGASGYAPENTIAAFNKAIEMGADYSELDVQETLDGYIVLTHDANLKRCTGVDKNVYDLTLAEIKKLDAGSWFDTSFANERIPELREVISAVKGKMKLNIELKTNGHQVNLADSTVKIVKEMEFADQCIFTSFDYNEIKRVKEIDSTLKTGLIFGALPANIDVYTDPNIDLLSAEQTIVDNSMVSKALQNNKEVHVWTVNNKNQIIRLLRLGVANIITNYPDLVLGYVSVNDGQELPGGYNLEQNYPNPFNPSTVINYRLPESGFISIKLFDALGNQISTIVSEIQSAGDHSVQINAEGFSSGVYFYQLEAGNFSSVKKMIKLK
jgi:glycerophosphoryl diester phosphodiesterase